MLACPPAACRDRCAVGYFRTEVGLFGCEHPFEMTHWTRHESRLDRDLGRKRFADAGYAMEELVAEIGAAFLCADLGITPETRDDHAAYIASLG